MSRFRRGKALGYLTVCAGLFLARVSHRLNVPKRRSIISGMRLVVLFALVGACTTLVMVETGSRASAAGHPLVGSYALVTTIVRPFHATARGTLVIDSYDPSTGAITGHGVSQQLLEDTMTGTVKGTTITMRVLNEIGVATDAGRIYPDGTIKGTITTTGAYRESGTWSMTPSLVSVGKLGFTAEHLGHQVTNVSYGIEIRNTSSTRDADNVSVTVEAQAHNGRLATDQGPFIVAPIRTIPAGQTFYFGGGQTLLGFVPIASLRVTVDVGSARPKSYVLPPVSNVAVSAAKQLVTASVTNPYRVSISPYDYRASVVLYDASGRIIGGDDTGDLVGFVPSAAVMKPGSRRVVEDPFPEGISPSRVASARLTVAPA